MTLKLFSGQPKSIPSATAWHLADLGEARGKQELFTKQSPQKLKILREHALIESAISSNRIEGVEIDPSRTKVVFQGKGLLRDRDEEEVRGYRDALKLIHERAAKLAISEETILRLHRLTRGQIWDAGQYKEKPSDIVERSPDGRSRVRFRTVSPEKTPAFVKESVALWRDCLRERWISPLIALAAFNLDFLCIHPFRDGNGRVSRLLMLLQCYHLGYEVGRYISLERLIEENKDRYYETLEQSSQKWHEGKHDPWPYVNFVLYTLMTAYRQLEERVGQTQSPRGSKTAMILDAINRAEDPFPIADIQARCPGVGVDLIRRVLKDLRTAGKVECLTRGRNSKWRKSVRRKLGNT